MVISEDTQAIVKAIGELRETLWWVCFWLFIIAGPRSYGPSLSNVESALKSIADHCKNLASKERG